MNDRRKTPPMPVQPAYSTEHYLNAIAQADGFANYLSARLSQIAQLTPQWPSYVWEEVSDYIVTPHDPVLQAAIDLGTKIGNINLRLDALYYALTGPVIK